MRTFDIKMRGFYITVFGKRVYKIVKMKKWKTKRLRLGRTVKAKLRSFKSSFVN